MKPIIAVPVTLLMVYRAHSHKSLTPAGIVAAVVTAVAHAVHPWSLPFTLLIVFFLAGTRVTKVKKDVKASLTMPSQGTSGGEGPRTHVQVFANSLVASLLSLLHTYQLHQRRASLASGAFPPPAGALCFAWPADLLAVGIMANYASVAADTFSSELGILSRSRPRLLTSPTLRPVPPGTNGGVTPLGLAAGLLGSAVLAAAAVLVLPACAPASAPASATAAALGAAEPPTAGQRAALFGALALWGALGSLVDSFLGGWLQRSVRDVRSGKIVEGEGGVRVLVSAGGVTGRGSGSGSGSGVTGVHRDAEQVRKRTGAKAALLHGEGEAAVEETDATVVDGRDADEGSKSSESKKRGASFGDERSSRVVESGFDLLDNNEVNLLMAATMSFGAMVIASLYWGVPLRSILEA